MTAMRMTGTRGMLLVLSCALVPLACATAGSSGGFGGASARAETLSERSAGFGCVTDGVAAAFGSGGGEELPHAVASSAMAARAMSRVASRVPFNIARN